MRNLKLDNDLKEMSIYVYNDGKGTIPDGWDIVKVDENKKSGYYAEVYKKGKDIALIYRGTDVDIRKGIQETKKDFIDSDIKMFRRLEPDQLKDAQNTYKEIKRTYPSSKVIVSGHSLGGSLAQLVSAETGAKAVTFEAYGTGKILEQKGYSQKSQKLLNITNYGNPKDVIFIINKNYQPGVTYVSDISFDYTNTKTKSDKIKEKLTLYNTHDIKNLGNLECAKEFEPQKVLKGGITYNKKNTLAQNQSFSDVIRSKWRKLRENKNSRIQNKAKKHSASGTTNGRWITINGNHVLVEK